MAVAVRFVVLLRAVTVANTVGGRDLTTCKQRDRQQDAPERRSAHRRVTKAVLTEPTLVRERVLRKGTSLFLYENGRGDPPEEK